MEVFSKSYLEEVVENQGKLFEYAEEHYPGIDVADFIESYMKSYARAMVDEGQAYVCTMDAETLYNYFLENDKYEPKQGKTAGGFAPNWIGQFYALFQWIYRLQARKSLNCSRLNLCLKHILACMILIWMWLFVRWESSVGLMYPYSC